MEPSLCARIDARLREDLVGNVMALKFLQLKGAVADGGLHEAGSSWVSWFHYAPREFGYDASAYGDRSRIVYWNANDPALALASLAHLPSDSIVKVSTSPCLELAPQRGTPVNRFVWFTAGRRVVAPRSVRLADQPTVEVYDTLNDDVRFLSAENGYDGAALEEQRARGCRWYLARLEGLPRAICFVQPNAGSIWEVSGVMTLAEARGRGLAKAVVAAAINDLIDRELVPRYFVHTANLASLGVVRGLGLAPRGQTIHYLFG